MISLFFPGSSCSAAPQSEELQHITTDVEEDPHRNPDQTRQGRAMYFTKTSPISTTKVPPLVNSTKNQTEELNKHLSINVTENANDTEVISHPAVPILKNFNATEAQNTSKTVLPVNDTQINATTTPPPFSNLTETQNSTFASKKRNLTRPDFIKSDTVERTSESRIVTDKPLSLETQNFLQTRIPPNVESSRRVIDQGDGGMDTGAIAGISFAALVLSALAGSTAFVLYRRRYLNKPQTLNDKCSNPDSSGYLDDSTIRVCKVFILFMKS